MANLKQLSELPSRLAPGHRLCGGCGASIAVRQVLMGAGDTPVVVSSATGCLEVSTTVYPYNSWDVPFIHNAFENSAATLSGVEAAFKALKRAGKIDPDKKVKFIAFGGDGGTYDIGLQSLSGAMERGHDMVYVCYDNGAYMNTGIQRYPLRRLDHHLRGGLVRPGQDAASQGPHVHPRCAPHPLYRTGFRQPLARPRAQGGEGHQHRRPRVH